MTVQKDAKDLFLLINAFEWKRKVGEYPTKPVDKDRLKQLILTGYVWERRNFSRDNFVYYFLYFIHYYIRLDYLWNSLYYGT